MVSGIFSEGEKSRGFSGRTVFYFICRFACSMNHIVVFQILSPFVFIVYKSYVISIYSKNIHIWFY